MGDDQRRMSGREEGEEGEAGFEAGWAIGRHNNGSRAGRIERFTVSKIGTFRCCEEGEEASWVMLTDFRKQELGRRSVNQMKSERE